MLIALGILLLVVLPLGLVIIWARTSWHPAVKAATSLVVFLVWFVLMFADLGL